MRLPGDFSYDYTRYPVDEWALVETSFSPENMGQSETIFSVGNGYLGLRGNVEEGRDGHQHGTFVNGFHETWPIRHAEEAFGFARVGQTIVNAPDAKIVRLYVDDEPLVITEADLIDYDRRLDFRTGMLERNLEWRTPAGKRVAIRSRRMTSFTDRHIAVITYDVTLLDAEANVTLSSQILNRQDGRDEYRGGIDATVQGFDPRKADTFVERVLQPRVKRERDGRIMLGYRCTNSAMTIAVAADHTVETDDGYATSVSLDDDLAKMIYRVHAKQGNTIRLTKVISYHTARTVPVRELADRCDRSLDSAREYGAGAIIEDQRTWLEDYWERADVRVKGRSALQQAIRWNLFQLAQATARTDGGGVAAKGVTGTGYGGHYFWDGEIYVMPFLSYTSPVVARNMLRFRQKMLESARLRAQELNVAGALFPWRTINGLESSAYYAASTAQYHIDADISFAVCQYVAATGDTDFLDRGAIDVLVETARMWADLGFWRGNGDEVFHIHGVTGPDEYTTVVNDNMYTNVMARANLAAAAAAVRNIRVANPSAYDALVRRLGVTDTEVGEWSRSARAMHIPFDDRFGIHPQDEAFLQKEIWDIEGTPDNNFPLLLHYHPLVIYRFQVLKQADVVLALFLQGNEFTAQQKRADFEYYDPLTTGDSSLSAVVQSIMAAEVGYGELAMSYFRSALLVDLFDLHGNAADGVHVASTGGVWAALVNGFGGFRDHHGRFSFDPRLPTGWEGLTYRLALRGTRIRVELVADSISFTVEEGEEAELSVRGQIVQVRAGTPVSVALVHQGARLIGAPTMDDVRGKRRSDGTLMTASIPTIALEFDGAEAPGPGA